MSGGHAGAPPARWRVGVVMDTAHRQRYVSDSDLARLAELADVEHLDMDAPGDRWEEGERSGPGHDRLVTFAADKDALVLCKGAARVDEEVLAAAPSLRFVGDLEGDRFGGRVDVHAAAARGVTVVDTTHSSSLPVAEWALALAIVGLREGPQHFRRLVAGMPSEQGGGRRSRELSGRTVALLGLGRVGWRLVELLRPFGVQVLAHDPFAARELAEVLDVTFGPLQAVVERADVVICLAPLTAGTRGMVDAAVLDRLRPGAVFVNVSRGAVVDTGALVERLRRGDVTACLDVHDPEPYPLDAAVRTMPNVFLSPHVAGVTVEAEHRFFGLMADELLRAIGGLEPRTLLTESVVAARHAVPPDAAHAGRAPQETS